MSLMFYKAIEKGWFAFALAWVIMVKQLLALLFFYFKRMLIVLFLISIFPLVMISYAIDKLGDGKSQAFGNWCKEFFLNVFIQSFHAIVYVIGAALIMSLGKEANSNWILLIILVTFLSKGEQILRNIFHMDGGGGDTVTGKLGNAVAVKKTLEFAGKAVGKAKGAVGIAEKGKTKLDSYKYAWLKEKTDEYKNATRELQENMEREPEPAPAPVPVPNQNMTPNEAAQIALDENSTEEERNAALDSLLDNVDDIDKLEDQVNLSKENLEELKEMLKVRDAARKIQRAIQGSVDVNLNENIEIILEAMKAGGRAGLLANQLFRNRNALERLKRVGTVKFKRPDASDDAINDAKKEASSRKKENKKRNAKRFRTPANFHRMQAARKAIEDSRRKRIFKELSDNGNSSKLTLKDIRRARTLYKKLGSKSGLSNLAEQRELANLERKFSNSIAARARGPRYIGKAKVRMTYAQKSFARAQSKSSMRFAKDALRCRKRAIQYRLEGRNAEAEKLENKALKAERIVSKARRAGCVEASGFSQKRRETRAQRYLDKGVQRSARRAIKEARRKKLSQQRLSATEERIIANAAIVRKNLRDSGVRITRRGSATELYSRPKAKAIMREERKDKFRLRMTNVRYAAEVVRSTVTNSKSSRVSKIAKQRERMKRDLRSRGVIIREPKYIGVTQSAAKTFDDTRQRINNIAPNRRAKKELRVLVSDARKRYKHSDDANNPSIKKQIKLAEKELRQARKKIQTARSSDSLKRAEMSANNALNKLKDAREQEQSLLNALKAERSKYAERGIKIKPPRGMRKLESDIKGNISKGYEKVAKEERSALRKSDKAAKSNVRYQNRNQVIIEANQKIIDSGENLIKVLADKSQKKREDARKLREKGEYIANNGVAEKLRRLQKEENITSAVTSTFAGERQILQSIAREEKIKTTQGFWSRETEKMANKFHRIGDKAEKVNDFIEKVENKGIEYGASAYAGLRNLKEKVASSQGDGRNLFDGSTLPEGIKKYTKSKDDAEARITINGVQAPSEPSKPINVSNASETTRVFVREGDKLEEGPSNYTNVISLNSQKEKMEAEGMINEVSKDNASVFQKSGLFEKLKLLSYSVVAINNSETGSYTASDIVSHIDNIKGIMTVFSPGTPEYHEAQKLYNQLKFNLDDYETNLRIQVVSDNTLISDSDPNKKQIIDSSVNYVKKLSGDNIFVDMLGLDPEDFNAFGAFRGDSELKNMRGTQTTIENLTAERLKKRRRGF